MNLKDVIEFSKSNIAENIDENPDDFFEYVMGLGEYFNQKGEEGKVIVLKRMKEETLVRFIRVAKHTLLASMMQQGDGQAILMADAMDNLDGFLHTIILNVIGMLAEEEVI